MNEVQSARQVVYDFMEDFVNAAERLNAFIDDDV